MRGMVVLLLVFLLAGIAEASNRALIIGIGPAYARHWISGIPGPEVDVEYAKSIALQMGFRSNEIKVLREEEATKENILRGLQWVVDGTRNGGKAFIYYSGHGTQVKDINGDEDDGCDEAIVPVDAMDKGLILDDEIDGYIRQMSQAEKIIIVDSCFSGTVTKGVYRWNKSGNTKFLDSKATCGIPVNLKSIRPVADNDTVRRGGIVVLTATAQNESAYGDPTGEGKGSLFTQAIYDKVSANQCNVTFSGLREYSAKRIREISEARSLIPHTPQLEGDSNYFNKDICLRKDHSPTGGVDSAQNYGELFERLINSSKFAVAIRADKKTLRVGERITFTVTSTKGGYLNILELEPNGNAHVVFPNGMNSQNRIQANQEIKVPGDIGGFKFEATEPVGRSRIIALVTRGPLNLYENNNIGEILGGFKSIEKTTSNLSRLKSAFRSLAVKPEDTKGQEFGASGIYLEVLR